MNDKEYHEKVIQMTKEAAYIDGIPERGCGRRFGDSVVNNILGYVKFLESTISGMGEPKPTECLKEYLCK